MGARASIRARGGWCDGSRTLGYSGVLQLLSLFGDSDPPVGSSEPEPAARGNLDPPCLDFGHLQVGALQLQRLQVQRGGGPRKHRRRRVRHGGVTAGDSWRPAAGTMPSRPTTFCRPPTRPPTSGPRKGPRRTPRSHKGDELCCRPRQCLAKGARACLLRASAFFATAAKCPLKFHLPSRVSPRYFIWDCTLTSLSPTWRLKPCGGRLTWALSKNMASDLGTATLRPAARMEPITAAAATSPLERASLQSVPPASIIVSSA